MVKDRTEQLKNGIKTKKKFSSTSIEIRNASDEEQVLMTQTSRPVIQKSKNKQQDALNAVFKKIIEIHNIIESIDDNANVLIKNHVILQQSPRTNPSLRNQIEALNESIRCSSIAAQNKIRDLSQNKTKNEESVINRVVQTQTVMLRRSLAQTMEKYEEALLTHQKIYGDLIKKQLLIVPQKIVRRCFLANYTGNGQPSVDVLAKMLDSEDLAIFVDNHLTETKEVMQMLQDAQERNKELLSIEKSIVELRNMFVELSINVAQQGEFIDTIEYHIGQGLAMTKKGQRKISKAHRFMKQARKKKMMVIACLTSVVGATAICSAVLLVV